MGVEGGGRRGKWKEKREQRDKNRTKVGKCMHQIGNFTDIREKRQLIF